jgi:hypothetical protein
MSLECKRATLAPPERSTTDLAFAEWRRLAGKHWALSPRLEYDLNDSEWAFRMPVYFITDAKGAFTAGVSVGYTTKDEDLGFSVFVSKAFTFFD